MLNGIIEPFLVSHLFRDHTTYNEIQITGDLINSRKGAAVFLLEEQGALWLHLMKSGYDFKKINKPLPKNKLKICDYSFHDSTNEI